MTDEKRSQVLESANSRASAPAPAPVQPAEENIVRETVDNDQMREMRCIDHAELQGHIISILALSRSSSLTSSSIVKQLLSDQQGLLDVKSKAGWIEDVNGILNEANGGRPVFSRVDRVGKVKFINFFMSFLKHNPGCCITPVGESILLQSRK